MPSLRDSLIYQQVLQGSRSNAPAANAANQILSAYLLKQGMNESSAAQKAGMDALMSNEPGSREALIAAIQADPDNANTYVGLNKALTPDTPVNPQALFGPQTTSTPFGVDNPNTTELPGRPQLTGPQDVQRGLDMRASFASLPRDKQIEAVMGTLKSPEFGTPVAGQSPGGEPVFFQPNEQGGPARVIPNVQPPAEEAEAPKTREIKRDDQLVTQEWDGEKYVDIAEAPRAVESDVEDKSFARSRQLRTEFQGHPLTKNYIAIRGSSQDVAASLSLGTAAGDMSAIFQIMKTLDPASTVRESEYATAEQARGVPEGMLNLYNKTVDGTPLTADQREEFQRVVTSLAETAADNFAQNLEYFQGLASAEGLNPESVVFDYRQDSLPRTMSIGGTEVTREEIEQAAKEEGISVYDVIRQLEALTGG